MNPTPTYISDIVERNRTLWALKKSKPQLFSKKLHEWESSIQKRLKKLRGDVKKNPKISVVIPAHNEEAYILPTLEGIAAQKNVTLVEVVVVTNNCSPKDTTAEICRRAGAHVIEYNYRNKKEKPIALARHIGLIFAKGDIYVSTDADTIAMPQWLQLLTRELTAKKNVGLVTSHSHMHGRENDKKIEVNDMQRAAIRGTLRWTGLTGIGHNSAFYRADAEKIGGYTTRLYPGEDADMSFRLTTTKKRRLAFVNDPDAEVWVSPRRVVRFGGYIFVANFFRIYKNEDGTQIDAREAL